jgi:hypothetical protein
LPTGTSIGQVAVERGRVRIGIDERLRGAQVTSLVRGIEPGMKPEAEEVCRVDVVPIGGARPVNP